MKFFGKSKPPVANSESYKSDFEKIKIFKSLPKERWKPAFSELNKIVGLNLKAYGFKKKGIKHYRIKNDLLEIIEISNRGSWSGASDYIEIRIGLLAYCWDNLTRISQLNGTQKIEEIDTSIRTHFRISQEYIMLANYLSERIIANILPFFDQYNSTEKIIDQPYIFPYQTDFLGYDLDSCHLLILFSELKQHTVNKAEEILDKLIEISTCRENKEELKKWIELKNLIENKNWTAIDAKFAENETKTLKLLKIKPMSGPI